MNIHEHYMNLAIRLATKAEGRTSPNPLVGAIVVKNGKIVGKGFHERAGLAHAEINALREAGLRAKGADLYVTLEPCDHFGRTPPCADAIIDSGVKRVFMACKDPNPLNNGRGARRLAKAGLIVKKGVLEEEAASINLPYLKYIRKKMPYVILKLAQSLDGKIATRTGDSRWISSSVSRKYVHELRSRVDAVMVGVDTVIKDDPALTSYMIGRPQGAPLRGMINIVRAPFMGALSRSNPVRVVVDSNLRTPLNAKLFKKLKISPVIIATCARSAKAKLLEAKGARLLYVMPKGRRLDLKALLKLLAGEGITCIMAEGGSELAASLIEERLVDKLLLFVAPIIIGGKDAVDSIGGRGARFVKGAARLKKMKIDWFGRDILIEGEF